MSAVKSGDQTRRVYDVDDDHLWCEDAWGPLVLQIARMSAEEQAVKGFTLLDEYWAEYGHRDHDGWLRRNIWSEKAAILRSVGRWADALVEYQALARFGLHAWYEPPLLAEGLGTCLVELGRHEEAVETLEDGLTSATEADPSLALHLLYQLSRAYAALGRPVPARHAAQLRASAAAHDAEVPAELDDDPDRLGEAIDAVYKATRPTS